MSYDNLYLYQNENLYMNKSTLKHLCSSGLRTFPLRPVGLNPGGSFSPASECLWRRAFGAGALHKREIYSRSADSPRLFFFFHHYHNLKFPS